MRRGNPGWLATSVPLSPGEHEYAILEDGQWVVDPTVPTTGFYDDQEVTWVDLPDCSTPGLTVSTAAGSADGHATIQATFLASAALAPLDPTTLTVAATDGSLVAPIVGSDESSAGDDIARLRGAVSGQAHTLSPRERHPGTKRRPCLVHALDPAAAVRAADTVIYEVMVDRYRGPNGAPLAQPSVAERARGGDERRDRRDLLGRVRRPGRQHPLAIRLSTRTPTASSPAPTSSRTRATTATGRSTPRATEPIMAPEADIDTLIATAHANGMRVLFDVVPNQVHEQHPTRQAHLEGGWFNNPDGTCICGITCDWASHIIDCWFVDYLPISTGGITRSPTRSRATSSGGSIASTATVSGSTRCR